MQSEQCSHSLGTMSIHSRLESVVQRCSVKKVFLEISQKSQKKHLYQSLFFNKVADLFKQNTSSGCFCQANVPFLNPLKTSKTSGFLNFFGDYRNGTPAGNGLNHSPPSLLGQCPYLELFWFVFSRIWTEYEDIQSIYLYSLRMRETMARKTLNKKTFHAVHIVILIFFIITTTPEYNCFY